MGEHCDCCSAELPHGIGYKVCKDCMDRIAKLEAVVEAAQTAQDMADDPNVQDEDLVAAALVLRERLKEARR